MHFWLVSILYCAWDSLLNGRKFVRIVMFNLTENLAGAILNFDTCISISLQNAFSSGSFNVDLMKKLLRLKVVLIKYWEK